MRLFFQVENFSIFSTFAPAEDILNQIKISNTNILISMATYHPGSSNIFSLAEFVAIKGSQIDIDVNAIKTHLPKTSSSGGEKTSNTRTKKAAFAQQLSIILFDRFIKMVKMHFQGKDPFKEMDFPQQRELAKQVCATVTTDDRIPLQTGVIYMNEIASRKPRKRPIPPEIQNAIELYEACTNKKEFSEHILYFTRFTPDTNQTQLNENSSKNYGFGFDNGEPVAVEYPNEIYNIPL